MGHKHVNRVGVASWNANRINGDKLEDAIDELQKAVGKSIIMMQEVARLPVDPSIEGWTVLHGDSCAAAIAIPHELSPEIRWKHNSDITSSALIGELGVVSAYFADSGKTQEEFEKSMMITKSELKKLRAAGAKSLVVGCDAQVELPPETEYTGPQALGNPSSSGNAHERQCQVLSLLREFGLRAVSTWTASRPFYTRKPWQRNRRCTQLDYIFVSKAIITESGVCNDRQFGASDHYPVWADLRDLTFSLKTHRLRTSLAGWKPDSEQSAGLFRQRIMEDTGLSGTARYDMQSGQSLGRVQVVMEELGREIPHSTCHTRRQGLQAKPIELIQAETASKAAASGDQKRRCRCDEGRLRRKWKTQKLLQARPHNKRSITTLECDGKLTDDRDAWKSELQRHCLDKYSDDAETAETQRRRVQALRSVQHNAELDGWKWPEMTAGVVLEGRSRLSTGKSAGGGEAIVAEMIRLLPIAAVYIIADLFAKRYAGEDTEDIEAWRSVIMIFLQKVAKPTQMKHFRGISLLSVLSKWYMQCLYVLARRCPRPAAWNCVCIYSYECCLGTDHITTALQLLLCRGWEWQLKSPVYVFNGDILAAFDNMRPDVVVDSLQAARVHPRIVAAMMSENTRTVCWPEFDAITLDEPIRFNKCAKQGGVESAYQWNNVMFTCLADLVQVWYESGYGLDLGGRRYTHAVWADNVWLFDHDVENLKKMMQSLTTSLAQRRLYWKPDSLCYMASLVETLHELVVTDGTAQLKVPNVDRMEVLGTLMEKNGNTGPSFQHRSAKAEKAFWSDKDVLTTKSLALTVRFKRYSERIVPRVLHGCGSWAWSQSLYQSLVALEGRFLRRIVGVGKRQNEDWLPWFRRATRLAKSLHMKHGFTPLPTLVLRKIHRAASRLQPPNATRFAAAADTVVLLADAIEWKDTWWWHQQQAAMQQLEPRGDWRHAPTFGTRGNTWDGVFVNAYGLEWSSIAKDPARWATSFEEFVEKAYAYAKSTARRIDPQPMHDVHSTAGHAKQPRTLPQLELQWQSYDREIGVEIVGDNETVVNWLNGQAAATSRDQKSMIESLMDRIYKTWADGLIAPRMPWEDWCRHVYRERNVVADELANRAMDDMQSTVWHSLIQFPGMRHLCVHFDGGKRDDAASFGWHLQGSYDTDANGVPVWNTLAWGSVLLHASASSLDAEFAGLTAAINAVLSWSRHGAVLLNGTTVCDA